MQHRSGVPILFPVLLVAWGTHRKDHKTPSYHEVVSPCQPFPVLQKGEQWQMKYFVLKEIDWSSHQVQSTCVNLILTGLIKLVELNKWQKKCSNTLFIHLAVFAFEVSFAGIQPCYAVKQRTVQVLGDIASVPQLTHAQAQSPVTARARRHPRSLLAGLQSFR